MKSFNGLITFNILQLQFEKYFIFFKTLICIYTELTNVKNGTLLYLAQIYNNLYG